ncbi:PREDICTED: uncharacterized protein At4g13200, chloroplastic [Tarenaya hassleriana]|uniref:uncharacterized protein At4g13200, chloroplastic n=1 Tax=Tarenaya hassleriana TaxID=28532 RepID=UPI00053C1342|nr:PREDICTED: uncharacterized protein At4g13200, chloroplastic [Tarenaya hassleriana]
MANLAIVPSSSSSSTILSSFARQPKIHQVSDFSGRVNSIVENPRHVLLCSSSGKLEFRGLRLNRKGRRSGFRCSCSSNRPGNGADNESRSVLDAFFLGKALAEVINERVESTVGEILSTIGRFQAEQQKQVQEIQEAVLERAKRAKERAAREAMEAQGLISPKPATIKRAPASVPAASGNGVNSVTPYSTDDVINAPDNTNPSSFSGASSVGEAKNPSSEDEDSL